MKIHTQATRAPGSRPPAAEPKPAPKEALPASAIHDFFVDTAVAAKFLTMGQIQKTLGARRAEKNAENPPLAQSPKVEIERPFVMVPGWTTTRKSFDPLADKLLEDGGNGGKLYFVQGGEFFTDRECSKHINRDEVLGADGKVFEVVFSDTRLVPSESHKELHTNLEAVRRVTSEEKLDVYAYSMGGLSARAYLDNEGDAIGKLMILGTANRGTALATWGQHLLERDVTWALSIAGLLPADLGAMRELSLEEDNPFLQGLNERWEEQKAEVDEVLIVGGAGIPTGNPGWIPATRGDGLVPVNRLAPPGEEALVVEGQHHGHLNNSAPVYDVMREHFGWKAAEE